MPNSSEVNWDAAVWQEINDAVVKEMAKVRVAQKVFPTTMLEGNPTEVMNEVIDTDTFTIKEGSTKQFVELYKEFTLTSTQVSKESQLKTCKTLARMAAKSLALAEDKIIFQGTNAKESFEISKITSESIESAGAGLLGEPKATTLNVDKLAKPKAGVKWGENLFSKVAEGIAKLTDQAQAPKYALFLPTQAYADTFVPPSDASLVTTAERIRPLVEGGFYGTGTLPDGEGLLVALGGDPTSLYVGQEATTEFVRKDGGKYIFRVVERVQFVARDARALVKLKFMKEGEKEGEKEREKGK